MVAVFVKDSLIKWDQKKRFSPSRLLLIWINDPLAKGSQSECSLIGFHKAEHFGSYSPQIKAACLRRNLEMARESVTRAAISSGLLDGLGELYRIVLI